LRFCSTEPLNYKYAIIGREALSSASVLADDTLELSMCKHGVRNGRCTSIFRTLFRILTPHVFLVIVLPSIRLSCIAKYKCHFVTEEIESNSSNRWKVVTLTFACAFPYVYCRRNVSCTIIIRSYFFVEANVGKQYIRDLTLGLAFVSFVFEKHFAFCSSTTQKYKSCMILK